MQEYFTITARLIKDTQFSKRGMSNILFCILTNHQNTPKTITMDYDVTIKIRFTWTMQASAYDQVKANHQNRKLQQYDLKHVQCIEKLKRFIIRSAGEDMGTRHAHMLWVERRTGISVINLPVSNHTANSCASLPRNLLPWLWKTGNILKDTDKEGNILFIIVEKWKQSTINVSQ